jgi:hypothetical protein
MCIQRQSNQQEVKAASVPNMANRSEVLSLYRRCLRSMMRIPDVDQRAVYRVYVRDGFRSKACLEAGCKQATNAMTDAKEQLDRMNYYHSIREMKERQKLERKSDIGSISTGSLGISEQSNCSQTTMKNNNGTIESDDVSRSNARKDERYLFVREWLVKFIPHLHEEDVAAYSNRLINDGFDCAESFRELHAEDLDFMKVAHRRAVVRALFS